LAVLVARLAADDDDVVAQPQDRRGAAVVAGPADGVAGRHVDGVVRDPGALDGADDVPGAAGDEEGAALQRGGDDVEGEDVAGGRVALLRAELAGGVVVVGPVVGDPVAVAAEDLDGGAVDAVVVALGVAAGDGVAGDEVVVAVEQDAEGAGVVVTALVVDAHPVVVGEPAVADRVAGGGRGDGDAGHVAVGLHPGQHVVPALDLEPGPRAAGGAQAADVPVVALDDDAGSGPPADPGQRALAVRLDGDRRGGGAAGAQRERPAEGAAALDGDGVAGPELGGVDGFERAPGPVGGGAVGRVVTLLGVHVVGGPGPRGRFGGQRGQGQGGQERGQDGGGRQPHRAHH